MFPWLPDFQRQMVLELFYKNVPESLYKENTSTGYCTTQGYWYVANFAYLTNLAFQCDWNCKTCLAIYDHLYLICEESSHTMTWYEDKTDL